MKTRDKLSLLALAVEDFADAVEDLCVAVRSRDAEREFEDLAHEARCLAKAAREVRDG